MEGKRKFAYIIDTLTLFIIDQHLDLPPHDARHLVLGLRDGGRDHEPYEVGQQDHVEDHKSQEQFSS